MLGAVIVPIPACRVAVGMMIMVAILVAIVTIMFGTITITCRSRGKLGPTLTPVTIASAVAAIAADGTLLTSFMVWPLPGHSPRIKILPITFSAGSTAAISARPGDHDGAEDSIGQTRFEGGMKRHRPGT